MDPNHHDRIVFMRICSGKFEKGMSVLHRQSNKTIRLSQPQQFWLPERTHRRRCIPRRYYRLSLTLAQWA